MAFADKQIWPWTGRYWTRGGLRAARRRIAPQRMTHQRHSQARRRNDGQPVFQYVEKSSLLYFQITIVSVLKKTSPNVI